MSAADLTSQGMPDGELLGTVLLVLVPLALILLWQTVRDNKSQPVAEEYEASPYGPMRKFRTDLCMVTNCEGIRRHDLGNGWLVCTDCRDEIEAEWAREQSPFDVELADLDDIETYANGGGAA